MTEFKIFENYGVMTHEKQRVYTAYGPEATAVCSQELTVYVPEGFTAREGRMGNIIIDSEMLKFSYDLSEILGSNDNHPCFNWIANGKTNGVMLRIKK